MVRHNFWKGNHPRVVNIAQDFLGEVLEEGDIAVDATSGNGNDTVYLAGSVGDTGRVFSFDIQEEAISSTRAMLLEKGLTHRVELLQLGHENMEDLVRNKRSFRFCKAAIFNLGYLPGAASEIKTNSETTLEGIRQALALLTPGGRLSVVVYRGHTGALEEAGEVDGLFSSLELKYFWVARITFPNKDISSPYVVLAQKNASARNE